VSPAPLRLEFAGSQGAHLAARLEVPTTAPRGFALFAHCFTCGKDAVAASRISRSLTESGIAVMRFDFTGLGQSDGDFASTNFSSNVEDLVRAADFLRERFEAPSILIGHSLGGAAVLAAAHRIPELKAVVTIAAPADPGHVIDLLDADLAAIERDGSAEVHLGGRAFHIQRQFLDDIAEQPQAERIRALGVPLLVLHSPVDQTVSIDNARRIFDAARHPKSFVSLDGADHLLLDRADAEFAARVIGAWSTRYVSPAATSDGVPADRGLVQVGENGTGTYGQTITAGPHTLFADEPEPVGVDSGPTPYDLLLAGLGACTSMTIRMYANRKQWPLDNVDVALRHSRVHASDCESCESSPTLVDHIDRVITLTGGLTDEQRMSILEIADKCPVHRTLHAGVHVTTSLAVAAESSAS
jgi:putative redox protein